MNQTSSRKPARLRLKSAMSSFLSTAVVWPIKAGVGVGLTVCVCASGLYWWNPDLASPFKRVKSGAATRCHFDPTDPWPSPSEIASRGPPRPVDARSYYSEYHGHTTSQLAQVHFQLRELGCNDMIFLAGDSSLDNKHWFFSPWKDKGEQMNAAFTAPAVNGYEEILRPRRMVKDVAYWLNLHAARRLGSGKLCTLMTSIEESTLVDRKRAPSGLLAQDAFIRDHITERDVLIVSVGGNDVALNPSLRTAFNMLMLTRTPEWVLRLGVTPGMSHFIDLFHGQIQEFVSRMVAKKKPKKVIVCMLYYLDETPGGSWADVVLNKLGYDSNPEKLQLVIRTIFERIQKRGFDVPGTTVDAFPLFKVLNGKDTRDYEHRVEPSVIGGEKMAKAFLDHILGPDTTHIDRETAYGHGEGPSDGDKRLDGIREL